jgi:hypothetical protein
MSKTRTKPAARSAEPKKDETLGELILPVFNDLVRQLALEENRPGEVARTILRAERDDKRESVKDLAVALMREITKAMPKTRKRDPKTGDYIMGVDIPKEWLAKSKGGSTASAGA